MNFDILKYDAVLLIFSVLAIAYTCKRANVFNNAVIWLTKKVPHDGLKLWLSSALLGFLPVEGRISVSCSMLDAMYKRNKDNNKCGVLAYLSSHHYYLWSPIEKSVVITMAALGISYAGWIHLMWPAAVAAIIVPLLYALLVIGRKEPALTMVDVYTQPVSVKQCTTYAILLSVLSLACFFPYSGAWFFGAAVMIYALHRPPIMELLKGINYKVVALVAAVVTISFFLGEVNKYFLDVIKNNHLSIVYGCVFAFLGSFILGSSAKFAGIAVAAGSVFGMALTPFFYLLDYLGYLISPTHKCVCIGAHYFNTKIKSFILPVALQGLAAIIAFVVYHHFVL